MPSATGKSRTFGLPGAVGIPTASTHKEAAAVFVQWMVHPDTQVESYQVLGNLPTRTAVLEQLNHTGKLASGDVLIQQAGLVEPLFAQGTPGWYPQFSSAVSTAINQAAKGQFIGRRRGEADRVASPGGHEAVTCRGPREQTS